MTVVYRDGWAVTTQTVSGPGVFVEEETGLLTAAAMELLGGYQVRVSERSGRPFAVLYLELDRLEGPNGEFESAREEERVVRETAELLLRTVRSSDVCARLGARSFCVLLSELTRAHVGPEIVRLRLLAGAPQRITRPGGSSRFHVRTGTATSPRVGGCTFAELLARAREAALAEAPLLPAT